ncbi:MAG: hypothetical protein EOP04_09400 [Proteobacteria bacterium]|nr:MAG: hypothetical protein EOP04_09400 [Pseudomonadota bacterium]
MADITIHYSHSVPLITMGKGAGAQTNQLHVKNTYDFADSPKASIISLYVETAKAFGVTGLTMNNFGVRAGEDINHAARKTEFGVFAA